MAITDYDTTASNNTTISGTNIDEGCSPAGINNAIRQLMADIASEVVGKTLTETISGTWTFSGTPAFTGSPDFSGVGNASDIRGNLGAVGTFSLTTYTSGSGTYNPPTDCIAIEVWCKGAGGGGGGINGLGSVPSAGAAGSGNPGGHVYKLINGPGASYTYAVGAAGTGGATGANNGTAGGDTTFTDGGSLSLTAGGGAGGDGGTSTTGSGLLASSTTSGTATGGDINTPGEISPPGRVTGGVAVAMPEAKGGPLGVGKINASGSAGAHNGIAGAGHGSGGSGGLTVNTSSDAAGGDGTAGVIIIKEYY